MIYYSLWLFSLEMVKNNEQIAFIIEIIQRVFSLLVLSIQHSKTQKYSIFFTEKKQKIPTWLKQ